MGRPQPEEVSANDVHAALLIRFTRLSATSRRGSYYVSLIGKLEAGEPLQWIRRADLEGIIPDLPDGHSFTVHSDGSIEAEPLPSFRRSDAPLLERDEVRLDPANRRRLLLDFYRPRVHDEPCVCGYNTYRRVTRCNECGDIGEIVSALEAGETVVLPRWHLRNLVHVLPDAERLEVAADGTVTPYEEPGND